MATAPTYLQTNQLHRAPAFSLVIDGRDISKRVEPRLVQLTLTESRGDEADQLDLTIDDSDGRMNLPTKGAELLLGLGIARSLLIAALRTVVQLLLVGMVDRDIGDFQKATFKWAVLTSLVITALALLTGALSFFV